jgi:hypothetical protein
MNGFHTGRNLGQAHYGSVDRRKPLQCGGKLRGVGSRPSQRSVAPGGSLPFESDVSEMCGGLIAFRAAAFVPKYGSDIAVREHFELFFSETQSGHYELKLIELDFHFAIYSFLRSKGFIRSGD